MKYLNETNINLSKDHSLSDKMKILISETLVLTRVNQKSTLLGQAKNKWNKKF